MLLFLFYSHMSLHCPNPHFVRNREEIAALSEMYSKNILKVEFVLQWIETELLQLVVTFPVFTFQNFCHKTTSSIPLIVVFSSLDLKWYKYVPGLTQCTFTGLVIWCISWVICKYVFFNIIPCSTNTNYLKIFYFLKMMLFASIAEMK